MIASRPFGKTNKGDDVTLYTVDNGRARFSVMDFGATLVNFEVCDKEENLVDIVLGYDCAEDYDNDRDTYFGATVGRFANRIGGGKFILNGVEYTLPANTGKHCLHGGPEGFSFKMYDINAEDDSITASIVSPDMEMGFPGEMKFTVKYTLCDTALEIEYFAESDKDTVCGFTNHSYFNLNGATSGKTVLNHTLTLDSAGYCEVDCDAFPTGDIHPVGGTPFDFRKPVVLSSILGSGHPLLEPTAGGLDNNMILCASPRDLSYAGTLYNPDNGIEIECFTDRPGIQIYTGTFLDVVGKKGTEHKAFAGICLETQNFPAAPNFSFFPSAVLKAGEKFYSKTVFKAGIK